MRHDLVLPAVLAATGLLFSASIIAGDFDPALDETLDVSDFSVDSAMNGGTPQEFDIAAGVATSGNVVGFSFEGTVAGISGTSSYASDLRLVVTSPTGDTYDVGGFTDPVNDWEFQGFGSTDDGTYSSQHLNILDEADAGDWTFTFTNDWDSKTAATMNWTDVSITLHKQAPAGGSVPVSCGTPVEETYCYTNDDTTQFLYNADDGTSLLELELLAGGIEDCCDEITIYDGSTSGDPVLFSGTNGGDLSGVLAEATGPDILLEVDSDFSVSCDTGEISPEWDWEVRCQDTGPEPTPVTCGNPVEETYCYANDDSTQFLYAADDGFSSLDLEFLAGGIEDCCDEITIYDGSTSGDPVLFSGTNGGDLAGVLAEATGSDILLEVNSDSSVSCDDGGVTPDWDWEVDCTAGGGAPALTISPDPLAFGDQELGTTSAAQSVTLENTGDADLTVDAVSVATGDFAEAGGSCGATPFTVTPGNTCTLDYEFSPTATGAASSQILVTSNAPSSPDDFTLEGNGTQAGIAITPDPLDFGDQEVDTTSAPESVTVENTGDADLEVSSVSAPGGDFAAAGGSCGAAPFTVTPGSTCTLDYEFSPTATGAASTTIDVESNAPSSPDAFDLEGNGIQAEVVLDTTTLDLGIVEIGEMGTGEVTVTNEGDADLVIDEITEPGDPFALFGGTCLPTATLAPDESCTIEVMFDPGQTEGSYESSFDIVSNAPSSPDTVTVQGVGEPIFAIPALNRIGLVLLALMLAMVAGLVVWRRQA